MNARERAIFRRLLRTLRQFREDARKDAPKGNSSDYRAYRRGMRDGYALSARWLALALRETR